MDAYRVSESEADLPALIDRMTAGEVVVITRAGRPIAELRLARSAVEPSEALHRLDDLRDALPSMTTSSADLIDQIREERELSVAGLL